MKVLVKINKNALYIQNKKRLDLEQKNMLNTNVISNDELIFSDEYIKKNSNIVATFLRDLTQNYELTTICFQNNEVALLFLPFIYKLKNITKIVFESDEVMSYTIYKFLITISSLKYVSSEYIPFFIFELLDKKGIVPQSRNEILFTSNFMSQNNLINYSSLFYKNTIFFKNNITNEDLNDFDVFLQINKHLRQINLYHITTNDIVKIIKLTKLNNHNNIKIIINDDTNNMELIDFLKKNKKDFKKKYKVFLKLKYSDKYIENNLIKETNNNILRFIGILILFIICLSFAYVFISNYKTLNRINNIQKNLVSTINDMDKTNIVNELETKNERKVLNSYIGALQTINGDVTSWLKVNNTNIDYAIVQTDNNSYYLKHNIYKDKDNAGWLFLDYQNNATDLDDNNIIYGHNYFHSGIMFGTLYKTMYQDWYTNKENQIITYDTLYGSYKFQVFSIYVTPVTTEYLVTNFNDTNKKMEFLKSIKEKSIYDFNVELNDSSKILTLSTCQSDTSRLVLHAVLLEEQSIVS